MAFCKNCGTELKNDDVFCPNCGTKVEESAVDSEKKAENNEQNAQTDNRSNAQKSSWEKFCDTPGITEQLDEKDVADNKAMGILAYISWLCLIPLLARKNSPFAQYHAKQGLFLAVIEAACWVLGTIVSFLPGVVGSLLGLPLYLIDLACCFFTVVGIINAAQGKARELPIIGKFNFFTKK